MVGNVLFVQPIGKYDQISFLCEFFLANKSALPFAFPRFPLRVKVLEIAFILRTA